MIIGLAGKKGSGKDTTADILVENHKFKKLAFAEPLKEGLKIFFNFSDEQVYGNKKEEIDEYWKVSPRKIMQFFGTDILRKMDENFWIKHMEQRLTDDLIVISDVRFQNEAEMIKKRGGYVIKINRETQNKNDIHESENQTLKVDYEIDNNSSLEYLREQIDLFLKIYG